MKLKHLSLACLLALPHMAIAEENPEKGWVAGTVERYFADDDVPEPTGYAEHGYGFGAEIGTYFNMNWAARFEIARVDLGVNTIQLGGMKADDKGIRAGIDAMYFLNQGGPYVFAGFKHGGYTDNHTFGSVGFGKQWTLKNRWRLVTEFMLLKDLEHSNITDKVIKLGFGYTFGDAVTKPRDSDGDGVYDSMDNCPNTPVGTSVDSSGCNNDSDGDGVVNSLDQCPNTPKGEKVGTTGCSLSRDSDQDGVPDDRDNCPNTPMTDKIDAVGCSMFMEEDLSVNLMIEFANNSTKVNSSADKEIREFAEFMQRFTNTRAEIQGYTSVVGSADYNMGLSQRRADAVRQILINQYGIDGGRLTAVGYGENNLLDDSNTAEAHRVNRRIEARVSATEKVKMKR